MPSHHQTGFNNPAAILPQTPQTLVFLEREGNGRGGKSWVKFHASLSKYFAHPYRGIWPMQMFGLPVKDVPP
jgi:hypothetical protein